MTPNPQSVCKHCHKNDSDGDHFRVGVMYSYGDGFHKFEPEPTSLNAPAGTEGEEMSDVGRIELRWGAIFKCVHEDKTGLRWVRVLDAEQLAAILEGASKEIACPICHSTDLTLYATPTGVIRVHCSDEQPHPAYEPKTVAALRPFFPIPAAPAPAEHQGVQPVAGEGPHWKRQESCSECDGDGCANCEVTPKLEEIARKDWIPCPICQSDYDGKLCHACRNIPVEPLKEIKSKIMALIDATAEHGAYFTSEEFQESIDVILRPPSSPPPAQS